MRLALTALTMLAFALAPATALAAGAPGVESATTSATTTVSTSPNPSSSPTNTATVPTEPSATAPGAGGVTTETATTTAATTQTTLAEPTVSGQAPQAAVPGATPTAHGHRHASGKHSGGASAPSSATPRTSSSHVRAPSPSALTPPPPSALGSALGVASVSISNFNIPPFLLPIYQAAGAAYSIPWQVLAAINEVETDYGRDLSLSSAGAEGWMQFLPSSWAQYGVDAAGDGYADPYNPADAIFAAARYLRAAGGQHHIRAAIFAYNHAQSYVESVMLRAQLLRRIPPALLAAIATLAEARFPVHAAAHFADGFPAVAGQPGHSLVASTIYSQADAPVIAVQDGTVAAIGSSPTLGRYIVLRDASGDLYTYGHLGAVATFYPVLTAPIRRRAAHATPARRTAHARAATLRTEPIPAATAGVQPRSLLSTAAISSALAFGAAATLEAAPPASPPLLPASPRPAHRRSRAPAVPRAFLAGHEEVHLHVLRVGAHVIAGTVIGHLAPAAGGAPEAELTFQIRPAGVGAPLIDPKPFLDAWVRLESSLAFRVTGHHRFPAAAPTKLKTAARLAVAPASGLSREQWFAVMTRLGEIPDPVVSPTPSTAAIPVNPTPSTAAIPVNPSEGGNGYH